ncbi:MAG: methylated-DNA--[protein]-cysteine S-methyltransferase [Desulfobacterales bacterium]
MNESACAAADTPLGPVAIRYQTHPFRLTALDLPEAGRLRQQHAAGMPEIEELQQIFELIHDYFNGRPIFPPWHFLAMAHLTELQRKVLYETAQIPYGSLKTYKQMAETIGRPRACRFVGSALAGNPFPLIIPCHRVIRSDGRIGNFGAGPKIKRWLIDFEAGKPRCDNADIL